MVDLLEESINMAPGSVVGPASHKQVVPVGNIADEDDMIGHLMAEVPHSQAGHFYLSVNLRQGSRIHCLKKCCFLKDVNNSAYCSEIWPTN